LSDGEKGGGWSWLLGGVRQEWAVGKVQKGVSDLGNGGCLLTHGVMMVPGRGKKVKESGGAEPTVMVVGNQRTVRWGDNVSD